jgi:5-methyltetrahydrofolate--homocysteine methyltransferase
MNPHSLEMMKSYYVYRALSGLDEGFSDYLKNADAFVSGTVQANKIQQDENGVATLGGAIIKGMKEKAKLITAELLKTAAPLSIVENEIIPAINHVGDAYDAQTLFLPSLLASAEAAKSAFEKIKEAMIKSDTGADLGEKIVLATVEGDIHDIGKNIVKLILENYGYNVIDLGKDVAPERILEAALKEKASFVGLSALMTTTVPAMAKTVALIKQKAPSVKVIVGGAVMTEESARKISADGYAKDAISAVKLLQELSQK